MNMYPEKSPSVSRIAAQLQTLKDFKKSCRDTMKAWKSQFINEIAASLNQYQIKANNLLKKREVLEKEEAELDSKICNYTAVLKGQQMLIQSATEFLTDYNTAVTTNKNISTELVAALKNTEKETDAYVQSLTTDLKTQREMQQVSERELQLYQLVFGFKVCKNPCNFSSITKGPAPTASGKGTVNIKVRWYTNEGFEKWTDVEVRPDPFLGNEVTVREDGVRAKVYTGVDISKLVAAIATGKFKELNTAGDKSKKL